MLKISVPAGFSHYCYLNKKVVAAKPWRSERFKLFYSSGSYLKVDSILITAAFQQRPFKCFY
jgi:hypothetical protein